jgi:hypothetical protein
MTTYSEQCYPVTSSDWSSVCISRLGYACYMSRPLQPPVNSSVLRNHIFSRSHMKDSWNWCQFMSWYSGWVKRLVAWLPTYPYTSCEVRCPVDGGSMFPRNVGAQSKDKTQQPVTARPKLTFSWASQILRVTCLRLFYRDFEIVSRRLGFFLYGHKKIQCDFSSLEISLWNNSLTFVRWSLLYVFWTREIVNFLILLIEVKHNEIVGDLFNLLSSPHPYMRLLKSWCSRASGGWAACRKLIYWLGSGNARLWIPDSYSNLNFPMKRMDYIHIKRE